MAYDRNEVQNYIRDAARRRGIDPETALRVIKQESGFNPMATNLSPKEKSYGLMQLNTQGGLGVHALEKGINIRDPNTWRQQVDFGLDVVAKDGWRQWYGARDVGIGRWDGIGGRAAAWKGSGGASPLVNALADRQAPSGAAAAVAAMGEGGNVASSTNGPASGSPSSGVDLGGQPTAPTVSIGLAPEQKARRAALEGTLEAGNKMGSNARNGWEALGGLAQVWAATHGMRELDKTEASELQKAVAGLSPEYQMIAQLTGGREGMAQAYAAQLTDNREDERRAQELNYREDEQGYRQGRDAAEDERAGLANGYRWNADRTAQEIIPGGPADPSRADPNFKPTITSIYTPEGGEQKGYFNQKNEWVPMGGTKAPSGGNGVSMTMPDGTTVQVGGGMKLTEGQSKDLNYFQRGNAALPTIEANESALASAGQNALNAVPGVGNYLTSDEYQTANQAGREFLAAILRKDTGAAITKQEFEIYGPMFLPQPGDGDDVLKQKRVSRSRAMKVMKDGLGSASPMADLPVPQNPGTPPQAGASLVPGSDAAGAAPPMQTPQPSAPQQVPQRPNLVPGSDGGGQQFDGGVPVGGSTGGTRRISEEEFRALPSGATFIAPDGTTRRKP